MQQPSHSQSNHKTYQSLLSPQESSQYIEMEDQLEHMALDNNDDESNGHDMGNMEGESNAPIALVKDYFTNKFQVTEIIFCILVAALGHPGPSLMLELYERTVPYQQTANGDTILDMYINRDHVDEETVPDWQLVVLCMLLPFILIIFYSVFLGYKNDLHAGCCAYLFATGGNAFITNCVKLYVGYWRPNFYSYCGFNENDLQCEAENNEPRKSFPSGHASVSFCSMTFLTIFFIGKIGLYRSFMMNTMESSSSYLCQSATPGFVLFGKRILAMVAVLPMLFATFVASSRVHDDMHHPADIVAGSIIGMLCASFSYGLW